MSMIDAAEAAKNVIQRIPDMYRYIKKYKTNIKELERKRKELILKKDDITRQVNTGEERLEITSKLTEMWFDDVKELMDDAKINELIDERKRKAKDKCCFGLFVCDITYRYFASKRAEEKTDDIDKTLKKLPVSVTYQIDPKDMEVMPTGYVKGLKSRDELLKKILGMLDDDQVYRVGICGMGAIGKTTLAKEVKQIATNVFDRIAMAEISEVPNIDRIQEQIAESIGLTLDKGSTTTRRADRLFTRLKQIGTNRSTNGKGGKTLIIMDNIWTSLNLGTVGIPDEPTIKILFTSRTEDVCSVMGVGGNNIISIPILPENEAQQLFRTLVCVRHDDENYKHVEEMLLKKCGGSPLAIVATASILKAQSYSRWLHFANELESNTPGHGLQETYTTIFERSYNLIPSEDKKKFFLLACLFQPGSNILINDMMKYGIGLELFQYVNNLNEAMELVKSWAYELRSSSLLWVNETEVFVKIHDVVRASAISFAAKDGQKMLVETAPKWLRKETWGTYTAISLTFNGYKCLSRLKFDMLEILLLQGNLMAEYEKIEDEYFEGMANLKVLDLTDMSFKESLPKSITALKNLKSLLLDNCELNDIKLVGELKSLLVLSFNRSKMKEFPKEIANLCNLQMMDLRVSHIADKQIPAGIIAKLSRLEGLFMCNNLQVKVAELNSLNNLSVVNQVHILDTTQLPIIGDFVNALHKYRIFVGGGNLNRDFMPELSTVLVINKISLKQILKYGWLKVLLSKTEFLELGDITGLKRLPQDICHDSFQDLKYLKVRKCDMDCILNTNLFVDMESFRNLKSLSLSNMDKLMVICDGVITPEMFSNLRDVSLEKLPITYALPLILGCRLTSIKVKDCEELKSVFLASEEELGTTVDFPSLKTLILRNLPALRYFVTDGANCATTSDSPNEFKYFFNQRILLPSLERLRLANICICKLWESPPNEQTCTGGDALVSDESNPPHFESLRNLKFISISSCKNLESLGSLSVAAHFLQLESLRIYGCENISKILTEEMHGEEPKAYNIFPKLTHLFLSNVTNLRSFYEGNHQLRLNALKRFEFEMHHSIVSVADSGNSAAFFNKKIDFPNLLDLEMKLVTNEVKELWHPSLISNPLPKLKKLVLRNSRGCRLIPAIAFQQLSTLELSGCDNKFVFSTSTPSAQGELSEMENQTPKLENLYLSSNYLMEGLFENYEEGSTNVDDMVKKICGHLRRLQLQLMEKINHLPLHLFTNLCSLSLFGMNLECLFTSELVIMGIGQILPMLEEISIEYCDKMSFVLDELGIGEDISAQVIVFPRLKRIHLATLDGARSSFNSSANSTLHFPALEEVWIEHTKFQSLFSGNVIAPKLRTIQLQDCSEMTTVFNAIELPSLMSLTIEDCPDLQSFSKEPLEALLLNKLRVDKCEYPLELVDRANHPINSFLMNQYNERSSWKPAPKIPVPEVPIPEVPERVPEVPIPKVSVPEVGIPVPEVPIPEVPQPVPEVLGHWAEGPSNVQVIQL